MGIVQLMKLLKSCAYTTSLLTEIARRPIGLYTSIVIYEYGRAYAPEAMAPVPHYDVTATLPVLVTRTRIMSGESLPNSECDATGSATVLWLGAPAP